MRSQRWREEFLVRTAQAGLPLDVARKVLRHAATLQRLAEAQCNGDWPADNGERKVISCPRCGICWVRVSMVADKSQPVVNGFRPLICQDCRKSDLIIDLVAPYGFQAFFAGDPRGAVVTLASVNVKREDFESGRERGISVPA